MSYIIQKSRPTKKSRFVHQFIRKGYNAIFSPIPISEMPFVLTDSAGSAAGLFRCVIQLVDLVDQILPPRKQPLIQYLLQRRVIYNAGDIVKPCI